MITAYPQCYKPESDLSVSFCNSAASVQAIHNNKPRSVKRSLGYHQDTGLSRGSADRDIKIGPDPKGFGGLSLLSVDPLLQENLQDPGFFPLLNWSTRDVR